MQDSDLFSLELMPIDSLVDQLSFIPENWTLAMATHDISESLKFINMLNIPKANKRMHLPARKVRDITHLKEIIHKLTEIRNYDTLGIERLFIPAGDNAAIGNYTDAISLMNDILHIHSETGYFPNELSITGYPDGLIIDKTVVPEEIVFHHLKMKQFFYEKARSKGHNLKMEIITQICADPKKIEEYLSKLQDNKIYLNVRLSVPGIYSVKKLLKAAEKFGFEKTFSFMKNRKRTGNFMIDSFSDIIWNYENLGYKGIIKSVRDLWNFGEVKTMYSSKGLIKSLMPFYYEGQISGFQVSTFNSVEPTVKMLSSL